jgi:hypothetical protein
MYPNNNQSISPGDYLDQIAPHTPNKMKFLNNKPILLTGITAIVLLLLVLIIGVLLPSGTKLTERLAARLTITESTIESSATNIKSSQLRGLNSSLKIYLTNTIRDITPILKSENVDINKLSKNTTSIESDADLLAGLEDARLNAMFDRTYAREIAYKLATILTLMRKIDNSAGSSALKAFLDDAITSLEPIQKGFANFNLATS